MKRAFANPAAPSLLLFAGMVLAGFVSMLLSWRIAARTLDVADQLPAILSGGVGGLVLVVVGTGLFVAQMGRLTATDDRADLDDVLDRASEVVRVVRTNRGSR